MTWKELDPPYTQYQLFLVARMYFMGLAHGLRNHDIGASKPSKSLKDHTQPGPHKPFTWLGLFWCLLLITAIFEPWPPYGTKPFEIQLC